MEYHDKKVYELLEKPLLDVHYDKMTISEEMLDKLIEIGYVYLISPEELKMMEKNNDLR